MTDEEFFLYVPWWHGLAWMALRERGDQTGRDELEQAGRDVFRAAPRYWALLDLARRNREQYAQLVEEQKRASSARYGETAWEDPAALSRLELLRRLDPQAAEVVEKAITLAKHWRDQEGANVAIIDAVCDAAEVYRGPEPEDTCE
jgi:hypothetical protein